MFDCRSHYYFGFSAATGELTDNHDIISVHTYQLESNELRRTENRRGYHTECSSR